MSLRRADHSSRGVLLSVVSECDRESLRMSKPWPTVGCYTMVNKLPFCNNVIFILCILFAGKTLSEYVQEYVL